MRILIISDKSDVHALAVRDALQVKGHVSDIFDVADYPESILSSTTISQYGRLCSTVIRNHMGIFFEDGKYDTVWLRRNPGPDPPRDMHPGDRIVSLRQCSAYLDGMLGSLYSDKRTFWVNPPLVFDGRLSKLNQLSLAAETGFSIPNTIISNDPKEIRDFVASEGGKAAFKLLQPAVWQRSSDSPLYVVYTTVVEMDSLSDDKALQFCPGIFQALVEKDYEVRVLCLGKTHIAVRLNSQEVDAARIDWRRGQGHIRMMQIDIPLEIQTLCTRYCDRLGIVHCSFDFIVTQDNRWIFLEINEQGQFLWLESRAQVPVLDAFTDFLVSRDPEFIYQRSAPLVQFDIRNYSDLSNVPAHSKRDTSCVAPD